MSRSWLSVLGGVTLASLMALALPTFPVCAAGDDDVLTKVQSAKTAADHEAIAKIYDAKAAEATREAAEHRRMGEAYKGLTGSASGKSYGTSAMPQPSRPQVIMIRASHRRAPKRSSATRSSSASLSRRGLPRRSSASTSPA